ncbi:MAG: hypothetical protein CME06_07120 [Gemmatimonadetes bacterium]|nr:hypothetical protein [Gemmatimonadota bacterium]
MDAWDLFIANLDTHEQGHVDIFEAEFDAFKQALLAAGGEQFGSGDTAEEACDKAAAKIEQALTDAVAADSVRIGDLQDAYDDSTNHGETQGAVLTCP